MTLVALAPQTNLALLLRTHPEVVPQNRAHRLHGRLGEQSATPPPSRSSTSGTTRRPPPSCSTPVCPAHMYGLDVFNHVAVPFDTARALAATRRTSRGRIVGELLDHRVAAGDYLGLIGDAGAVCASSIRMPSARRSARCGSSSPATPVARPSSTGASRRGGPGARAHAASTVGVEVALAGRRRPDDAALPRDRRTVAATGSPEQPKAPPERGRSASSRPPPPPVSWEHGRGGPGRRAIDDARPTEGVRRE